MLKRIITGTCLVLFLLIPSFLFMDTLFLPAMLALLSAIGVFEMLRCIGQQKNYLLAIPAYLVALAAPFGAYYADIQKQFFPAALITVVLSMFFLLSLCVFLPEKNTPNSVALTFLLCTYVVVGFCSVGFLAKNEDAKLIYPMIFLGSFVTDVFCYFTGILFGKHKLIPRISPHKTIEGSIGGTVCCMFAFLLYGFAISRFFDCKADYFALAVTGFILALISQLGDLIASSVKRCFGVKDYGKIFPGHGGVMGRFDAFVAVAGLLAISSTQLKIDFFH